MHVSGGCRSRGGQDPSYKKRLVRVTTVAAMLIALVVAVGCGGDDDSGSADNGEQQGGQDLTSLSLTLPVKRELQYYPFYVAQELGYYEEEGLDVTIEVVAGGSESLQQMLAGNADVAMTASASALQGLAQEHDLKWVFTWFYENVYNLASPEDSAITSLDDLGDNGDIGVSELSGGEVPEIRGIMGAEGYSEGDDYTIVPVGEGGALTYESLDSGRVDAYSSTVFDIAAVENAGMPLRTLLTGDYLYLPSTGIVVTDEILNSRRDDLVGFHRAVVKAWQFGLANPDAVKQIVEELAPELYEDPELAESFWDTTFASLEPPEAIADEPLGVAYLPGWETFLEHVAQGTVEEGAIAEGTVDLDEFLDDSVAEEANDFDLEEVEEDAANYEGGAN